MSRVIKDQVQKAETLISGLRKNSEISEKAGVNADLIAALETEVKLLNGQNQELEQLSERAKSVSRSASKKLIEVRKHFQEIKRKVKMSADPSKWAQVGILDKK
jgi:DNA repair exonuclease SbcCD ATPase subunit